MIKISIIIPTFNRKNHLERILLDLRSRTTKSLALSTTVIDDGSNDGTKVLLKKCFPEVNVIEGNGNWWYTKCMNEGFKAVEKYYPDYFLTLNDDIKLADNYFEKLEDIISIIDNNTIVNSISLTSTKPHQIVFCGVKKYIRWRGKSVRYFPPFKEIPLDELTGMYSTWIISGRGILIPIKILQELNYFDEKFPQYGSDDDFGLRAIENGYKVFVSRDLKIFEDTKLTSKGIAFNNDGFVVFIKSFFNKYSVNSLSKLIRFTIKHGYPVLLPLNIIIGILGTSYAYYFKYNKFKMTNNGQS
jgi:GT2 family glycosyltransferase